MAEGPSPTLNKLLDAVGAYEKEFTRWEGRATKIIRKYRDDTRSQSNSETARFNILWSNVQTLIPAVYARLPKADVSRRFGDNDPVGRVSSLLLERCLDYEIEHYTDYRSAVHNCVEDRFLGGRGTSWVRYDPHVRPQEEQTRETQITEDVQGGIDDPANFTSGTEAIAEEIDYECAPCDYVHWKDFGHSVGRTWEEVTAVWRWVYMTDKALEERFGKKKAKKIPKGSAPDPLTKWGQANKQPDRAKICEYWDKEAGKVYWFSRGMGDVIEERDDPLELEGFFPCAKPLYATTTSDSLVPIPDFTLYQDQANELDILSDRIDGLVKSLRVRGVYDASQPALQRLLTEGENNSLIPVEQWMGFSEKGGLKGSIDLLPLDTLAAALLQCYQARADIKGQIYEITGIADIIRGSTNAAETATAQQIKGQYAGLRLRSAQEKVALFATELLRIKAQIICTKYQDETILQYAAAAQLSPEDQQMIPAALQLLRDNPLRGFRIDIAADSLVQIDEQQDKQDRLEFMQAFAGFMQQAVPAGQAAPEMVPAIMEMLKYVVAGFKQARTIEGVLDQALEQLKAKAAQAAQNPKPSEAEQEAQADMALKDKEFEQTKELKVLENQLAIQKEEAIAKITADKEIMIARIGANPGADLPMVEQAATYAQALGAEVAKIQQAVSALVQMQQQADVKHQQLMGVLTGAMQLMAAPKEIIRGPDGRAVGARPVVQGTMQ